MRNCSAITKVLVMDITAALLSGCTMGPKYQRPDLSVPEDYGKGVSMPGKDAALPLWRRFFTYPVLQEFIGTATENDQDLHAAMLNIEKIRGRYRNQRADLMPTVNAAVSSEAQRIPSRMSETGSAYISRTYSTSLDFSTFELDLFGRVRSLTKVAEETYFSQEEGAWAAQTSLMAGSGRALSARRTVGRGSLSAEGCHHNCLQPVLGTLQRLPGRIPERSGRPARFTTPNKAISPRLLRETNALTPFKSLGGGWQ